MKLFPTLLFWIVLALAGAFAAQWLLRDPGYVLVRYNGTDYSTTLVAAAAMLAGALLALWLLWTLLSYPFRAVSQHRDRRARARLGEGLDALHQGRYERAEKLLEQAASDEASAASARVNAARAALARGDSGRARTHLEALDDRNAVARALAVADLALAEQRPTDALVALDAAAAQPLPPRGLLQRAQALALLGKGDEAYGLLGTLRKQQALPAAELDALQAQWAETSLRDASDGNALATRWEALPKHLKADPAIAAAYTDRAAELGWHEAATKALEQGLANQWDDRLVERYGALPLGRIEARLANAERWLREHPTDPVLLLALARLHRLLGQWPKSEDYLHRALQHGAGAQAWEEFGHGLSAGSDQQRARIAYANALRTGRGEAAFDLEPAPSPATLPATIDERGHSGMEERDDNGLPRLRG